MQQTVRLVLKNLALSCVFSCLISGFFWLLHWRVICRGRDTHCNCSTVSYAATVSLTVESEFCTITTINSNIQFLRSSLIRVSQNILQKGRVIRAVTLLQKTFQQRRPGVSPSSDGHWFGNPEPWILSLCGCQTQHCDAMARKSTGTGPKSCPCFAKWHGEPHHLQHRSCCTGLSWVSGLIFSSLVSKHLMELDAQLHQGISFSAVIRNIPERVRGTPS